MSGSESVGENGAAPPSLRLCCEICDKTILTERGLKIHQTRVHGNKKRELEDANKGKLESEREKEKKKKSSEEKEKEEEEKEKVDKGRVDDEKDSARSEKNQSPGGGKKKGERKGEGKGG